MAFGCCLFQRSAQHWWDSWDHTFWLSGLLTQLPSCWQALIPGRWWTYLCTLRHTCLFMLLGAWCCRRIKKKMEGGFDKAFCCCMSYGGSFGGSLTGSASTLLAAAAITKTFKSPAFLISEPTDLFLFICLSDFSRFFQNLFLFFMVCRVIWLVFSLQCRSWMIKKSWDVGVRK